MKTKVSLLILLAVIFTLTTFAIKNNKTKKITSSKAAAPLSILTPAQKIEETNTMDSPDGDKTLTLEKKGQFQTIFSSSKTDGKKIQIYKEEAVGSDKLEVPYNTWSPDNIHVFLKEKSPTISNYLIFQSSGEMFSNNLPYLSIQELFQKNIQNYFIEDVTGWAAPNLLIINTKENETGNKVSFWFDVPSQSFIRLGTYFR